MKLKVILGAAVLAASVPAAAETLNNATVVSLSQIGLGEEAIVAKIHGSVTQFDVSTDALIALKKQGASSLVIAPMIEAANGGNEAIRLLFPSTARIPWYPTQPGSI